MTFVVAPLSLALYAWATALLWRARQHATSSHIAVWVILGAIAAHAVYLHLVVFRNGGSTLSLLYVVNVVALVMSIFVTVAGFRLPVQKLLLLVVPLSILALVAALTIEPGHVNAPDMSRALLAHILISLTAYSTLMLAACQSVLLAVLERQLKSPGRQPIGWLPPLETMEQLLVAMLWVGLALLTGAILTGFLFLEDMFQQNVAHHIVITSLSWLIYAFFLAGRIFFGWRGLTAVRWTLVGFAFLVIGYLGSKFVLEYILVR